MGFPTALASAVGLIMASPVILTATSGFGMAAGRVRDRVLIAFVLMQAQATTFCRGGGDSADGGLGLRLHLVRPRPILRDHRHVTAYFLVHVFAGTAETILSGVMAIVNFQSLMPPRTHGGSWVVGVGLVDLVRVPNTFGIRLYGKVEIVLTPACGCRC